jgi:hypothetical protein
MNSECLGSANGIIFVVYINFICCSLPVRGNWLLVCNRQLHTLLELQVSMEVNRWLIAVARLQRMVSASSQSIEGNVLHCGMVDDRGSG